MTEECNVDTNDEDYSKETVEKMVVKEKANIIFHDNQDDHAENGEKCIGEAVSKKKASYEEVYK